MIRVIPKRIRVQVLLRDHSCCRRCGVHISVRGYSIHHRKGRQGPDADQLPNLVTLCGSGTTPNGCHQWAHNHPEKAYAAGWMVRRLSSDDPAQVPLVTLHGQVIGLTDDGQVIDWPSISATALLGCAAVALDGGPAGGRATTPSNEGDQP